MSNAAKDFRTALETIPVRLVHVWGGPPQIVDGWATTAGMWVHWPLAGDFRLSKRGLLGNARSKIGRWRVHQADFKELRRRYLVLTGENVNRRFDV